MTAVSRLSGDHPGVCPGHAAIHAQRELRQQGLAVSLTLTSPPRSQRSRHEKASMAMPTTSTVPVPLPVRVRGDIARLDAYKLALHRVAEQQARWSGKAEPLCGVRMTPTG